MHSFAYPGVKLPDAQAAYKAAQRVVHLNFLALVARSLRGSK